MFKTEGIELWRGVEEEQAYIKEKQRIKGTMPTYNVGCRTICIIVYCLSMFFCCYLMFCV